MIRLTLLAIILFQFQTTFSQISASGSETCPLKVGAAIPEASISDVKLGRMDISEALASKPTILIFYRGGWCPYCNVHLAALQEKEQTFIDMGYQIIAVTPDPPENVQKTLNEKGLTYRILSDDKYELMSKMGLAYTDRKNRTLPVPSVYIVDGNGIVQFSYVNTNFRVRIEPELLIKAAEISIKK